MIRVDELKEAVQAKYRKLAKNEDSAKSGCCSPGDVTNIMSDSYEGLEGYFHEADLGLGCGLPTQYAQIKPGHAILDLGSGAGNDCFIARKECGLEGRVVGVDFVEEMVDRATQNAEKLGYDNVSFIQSDIENMPLDDESFDVVVSNCVLNLLPKKDKIFGEIYRVLKKGGHFSISDIVLVGHMPDALVAEAELFAGCVSGAIPVEDYLQLVAEAGFKNITIQKQKPIALPSSMLEKYLDNAGIQQFTAGESAISSLQLFASK